MLLMPGLPLLALAVGDVFIAQQGIPVCGHLQRLALLGGDGVAHEKTSFSRLNSRQCSVALAMYFLTELTDTLSRAAMSA